MNKAKLQTAMFEARRFLLKAKNLDQQTTNEIYFTGNALSGSVKRASMDLTRALADLRKPL